VQDWHDPETQTCSEVHCEFEVQPQVVPLEKELVQHSEAEVAVSPDLTQLTHTPAVVSQTGVKPLQLPSVVHCVGHKPAKQLVPLWQVIAQPPQLLLSFEKLAQ
jgi:hypothetical protein